jgi:type IV pilus modification protein PilV
LDKKGFTPHLVKPISSPSSLLEAGRAERVCRGAPKYLPHTFDKVRSLPQRKSSVLIRGAGFTLIEVLIGLIILAIGLLALGTLQITSTRGNVFSNNLMQASYVAQDGLESLKNLSYANLQGQNNVSGTVTISGITFTRLYVVTSVNDANGNYLKIDCTVSWNDGVNHNISFSTIRSQ